MAVAAMIAGDKSIFYKCEFLGFQDTLWDVEGRHYFKLCTIEGAVDFIFGNGQSIYEVKHHFPHILLQILSYGLNLSIIASFVQINFTVTT